MIPSTAKIKTRESGFAVSAAIVEPVVVVAPAAVIVDLTVLAGAVTVVYHAAPCADRSFKKFVSSKIKPPFFRGKDKGSGDDPLPFGLGS